jgi:hypothetical protein
VRLAVGVAGRERHAVRLGDAGIARGSEPVLEQLERVVGQAGAVERRVAILDAHTAERITGHWCSVGPPPGPDSVAYAGCGRPSMRLAIGGRGAGAGARGGSRSSARSRLRRSVGSIGT